MKRKILSAALFVAIAVAAGWNFNQSKNEMGMSELALANVDALAGGENPTHGYYNWDRDCCDTGGSIACYYDCPD